MLRTTASESPRDWPARLPALLAAYRMSQHSTTHITPNRAMLGREVLLPATLIAEPPQEVKPITNFVTNFQDNMRQAHHQVRDALGTAAKTEKRYFDKRVKAQSFVVGQKVWLYWPRPLIRQQKKKLVQLWTGPWQVLEILSPLVVKIQHVVNKKKQTVHVDRLLPCLAVEPDDPPPVTEEHQADADQPATPLPASSPEHQVSTEEMPSIVADPEGPIHTRLGRSVRRPARYLL